MSLAFRPIAQLAARYVGGRVLRAAGRTAVRYAVPAASAARAAYAGYSAYKRARTSSGSSKSAAKSSGTVRQATSRGRFSRAKRAPRRRRKFSRKFSRKSASLHGEAWHTTHGASSTVEVSGTVADRDCVYIGHAPYIPAEITRVVVYALLRRLYYKAFEYDAVNLKDIIPYRNQDSLGHTIKIWFSAAADINNIQNYTYVIPTNQTLVQVADLMNSLFRDSSTGDAGAWQNARLLYISLEDTDTGNMKARVNLIGLMLETHCVSTLKIQNQTTTNSTDNEADDVNNVPLIGKMYRLKGTCPQPTDVNMSAMGIVGGINGMTIVTANSFTGQQYEAWKEPPVGKVFANCRGTSAINLPPGTIKTDVVVMKKKMQFEVFLKQLHNRNVNINDSQYGNRIANSNMFAMEKMISLAGSDNIKTIYECNKLMCATVFEKHRPSALQKTDFVSYSQVPV